MKIIALYLPRFTLWLFMENGQFIDGLPIKNGDFPWQTVSLPEGSYLPTHQTRWEHPPFTQGIQGSGHMRQTSPFETSWDIRTWMKSPGTPRMKSQHE